MALHHVAYIGGVDSTFRDPWVLQLLRVMHHAPCIRCKRGGVNVEVGSEGEQWGWGGSNRFNARHGMGLVWNVSGSVLIFGRGCEGVR